ncbi:hypothetical protein AT6N2_C2777 [Agrobacterium tumefaciens]|nr:hypothetical protein AT6N2_C2777 [Agrobacterium tumefaciens]
MRQRVLPFLDRVYRPDEHDHIERQIIADQPAGEDFKEDGDQDRQPDRHPSSEQETKGHENRIHRRIQDTVARVPQRHGRGSVAIDDDGRIFQNFPSGLHQNRKGKPHGKRLVTEQQPREPIEQEAVNDMRRRVPVSDVLRVARRVHARFEQLHITAFADRNATHGVENDDLQEKQPGGHAEPLERTRTGSRHLRNCHFSSLLSGSTEWRMTRGICAMVKMMVIGIVPQTLKATQVSVENMRQTTSFSTARKRKKMPQRRVSLRQPSSVSLKAELKT